MSSEESKESIAPKEDESKPDQDSVKEEKSADTGTDNSQSVSTTLSQPDRLDDEVDDPLVIDEAEEKSDGADSDEKEFEPTLDMMMNDFDDERTMEEEEALEADEDEADELSALENEQDMPLEDLLKLYNYGGAQPATNNKEDESSAKKEEGDADEPEEVSKEEKNGHDVTVKNPDDKVQEDETGVDGATAKHGEKRSGSDSPQPYKKSRSELARFYEGTVEGRALRSTAVGQGGEEPEEEDSDGEYSDHEGRDYSWKKTIMIGPSYQASVPGDLSHYGDSLPYENEDKKLWDPTRLSEGEVQDYLAKSEEALMNSGVQSLPMGDHVRDSEQALFLLLQCGYNSEEALRRRRMNAVPPADTMSLWSEEECRAFELGLRLYGKDFHTIQQQKVKTRSVGELIQFYYLWKKTERHDVFANSTRLEKKKYTLHPGTTDYMDRFIDEQDALRDRSSSPTNIHSLIIGTETKKGVLLNPPNNRSPGVQNGDQTSRLSALVSDAVDAQLNGAQDIASDHL